MRSETRISLWRVDKGSRRRAQTADAVGIEGFVATAGDYHTNVRRLHDFCSVATSDGVGAISGLAMFKLPAYDPVAIAILECGILLAAALVSAIRVRLGTISLSSSSHCPLRL